MSCETCLKPTHSLAVCRRWPRRSWIRSAPICCWTAFIPLLLCGIFWNAANGKNSGPLPTRCYFARSFCFWLTTSATTPRRRPSGAPLSARACWTMAERPSLRCRPSLPISTHCWSPISFMRSSVLTSRGRTICGRWANTISSIPASAPIC